MITSRGAGDAEDPVRRRQICAQARRCIQDRQFQLATFTHLHDDEIAELEAALRHLWELEEKNKNR